jgi:hypothetical protein
MPINRNFASADANERIRFPPIRIPSSRVESSHLSRVVGLYDFFDFFPKLFGKRCLKTLFFSVEMKDVKE